MTGDPSGGEVRPALLPIPSHLGRGAIAEHRHSHHLLAWTGTATIAMRTGTRDWLVPPTHALWVPAGTDHAVEVLRPGHGCVVVLDADGCPITWAEPTGVLITPLVRELILHLGEGPVGHPTHARAESLLLDLLEPLPSTVLHVPLPHDPRARAIADALIADPADQRDLSAWARHSHAGVRTITRLFSDETGMTFAQWRTRIRIRAALVHLTRGATVNATARAVGYRKPAAFSAAFRRTTGQSPGTYVDAG